MDRAPTTRRRPPLKNACPKGMVPSSRIKGDHGAAPIALKADKLRMPCLKRRSMAYFGQDPRYGIT
jgi:hypothetical protein